MFNYITERIGFQLTKKQKGYLHGLLFHHLVPLLAQDLYYRYSCSEQFPSTVPMSKFQTSNTPNQMNYPAASSGVSKTTTGKILRPKGRGIHPDGNKFQ
jgi:hypothetical protein